MPGDKTARTMAATLVAADEIRRVPMRTITMLFAAAVVLASVVAAADIHSVQ